MGVVTNFEALLSGYYWNAPYDVVTGRPLVLTYSFVKHQVYENARPETEPFYGPLQESHKEVVRAALQEWAAVSGVIFKETTRHIGDLQFGFYNLVSAAGTGGYPSSQIYAEPDGSLGVYSGQNDTAGVIRLAPDLPNRPDFFRHVVLHEIGHALGLKHPHDGDVVLAQHLDNGSNTVMTYVDDLPSLGIMDIQAIQTIYGNPEALVPFTWDWNAVGEVLTQYGTSASEYIRGSRAPDIVHSQGGEDVIVTLDGDDIVYAYGQSLEVNFGRGMDTLVNVGVSYGVVDYVYLYQDVAGAILSLNGQRQMLLDVERVHFQDAILALDVDGVAGQVYRIYKAAFARTPDNSGLKYWIERADQGATINFVAENFTKSEEFGALYKNATTSEAIIGQFYRNVLDRDGETSGVAYWKGQLDTGSKSLSEVLLDFSESPENVVGVASAISEGILIT